MPLQGNPLESQCILKGESLESFVNLRTSFFRALQYIARHCRSLQGNPLESQGNLAENSSESEGNPFGKVLYLNCERTL